MFLSTGAALITPKTEPYKRAQLTYITGSVVGAKTFIDKMYTHGWYVKAIESQSLATFSNENTQTKILAGDFIIILEK